MLDATDRQLIALLRTEARMPVAKLAAALGVTRATVRARLDRLVTSGIITGFTVTVRDVEPGGVRAVTLIEVDGRHAESVIRRLSGLPEIRALHTTNGRWDIVAEIEVPDLTNLTQAEARARLDEVGLQIGQVTPTDDPQIEKDRVISSDPAARARVPAGSEVAINVSSGMVQLPDLAGQTYLQARDAMLALGLGAEAQPQEDGSVAPDNRALVRQAADAAAALGRPLATAHQIRSRFDGR